MSPQGDRKKSSGFSAARTLRLSSAARRCVAEKAICTHLSFPALTAASPLSRPVPFPDDSVVTPGLRFFSDQLHEVVRKHVWLDTVIERLSAASLAGDT